MGSIVSKLIIAGILILFVIGCTPIAPECPKINCPAVKCPDVPAVNPQEQVFVYFINVGQGDSILIKSGETEMLIDCGKNSAGPIVADFLKLHQVGDLEYLLITHPDSDHLGGCDDILKAFKTHSVIVNGQESDTASYKEVIDQIDTEQYMIANKGNAWNIGPAELRIIQANNGLSDPNENSIVSKFTYGAMDVLLTGDCDNKCEDLLLNKNIQSEILKIAHHGTKYATEIDFLEIVKPQAAIISVGENSYGHPADETLDRLTQEGVLIYRTDIEGSITIKLTKEAYEIA